MSLRSILSGVFVLGAAAAACSSSEGTGSDAAAGAPTAGSESTSGGSAPLAGKGGSAGAAAGSASGGMGGSTGTAGSDVGGGESGSGGTSAGGGMGGSAGSGGGPVEACVGKANLPKKPNIVIFISDDHSQADSQPYGNTFVDTPTMQQLANEGVRFDRAYVGSPSCAPSRTILLSGVMSVKNGVEANHSLSKPSIKKLPSYLKPLGYTVAAFGKVRDDKTPNYDFDVEKDAVLDSVQYLKDYPSDKQLLLFAGSHDPHVPWTANRYQGAKVELPKTFIDDPKGITRQRRRFYYTDINNVDQELKQVYDAAKARFGDNLLFLYTSDHGAQWPFAKWTLYEAGLRVPLLAVWPKQLKPKSTSSAMLSWLDFLPTLIELAGGTVPADLEGHSFLPLLECQGKARDSVFATHTGDLGTYPSRAIVTATHKYIKNLHPEFKFTTHIDQDEVPLPHHLYWPEWLADTRPESKAVVKRYFERSAEELYDLRTDPDELHNLAAEPAQAAVLAELRGKVDAWMAEQGDMGLVKPDPIYLP